MKKKTLSKKKAAEIVQHGEVHGKPLSPKQERFMRARAGGAPMRKGKRGR